MLATPMTTVKQPQLRPKSLQKQWHLKIRNMAGFDGQQLGHGLQDETYTEHQPANLPTVQGKPCHTVGRGLGRAACVGGGRGGEPQSRRRRPLQPPDHRPRSRCRPSGAAPAPPIPPREISPCGSVVTSMAFHGGSGTGSGVICCLTLRLGERRGDAETRFLNT